MPIVTEEELVKIQKKTEADKKQTIETKIVAGSKVFVGANGVYYTTHGEAFESIQTARERAEFKKLGLNENGQTPEQEKQAVVRKKLIVKREELVQELAALDVEISSLVTKPAETVKSKK